MYGCSFGSQEEEVRGSINCPPNFPMARDGPRREMSRIAERVSGE